MKVSLTRTQELLITGVNRWSQAISATTGQSRNRYLPLPVIQYDSHFRYLPGERTQGCRMSGRAGVDDSASNDHSNLIQEVQQALLMQRLRYQADEFTHYDALYLATKGGAEVLGRDDIGELAVGKKSDIGLYKLDEPRFSGAHDPLVALVVCGAALW